MMKLFRYLTLAIMVALSISACTTDEPLDNPNTKPGTGGSDFVLDETKSYPLVSSNPDIVLAETTETVTIILNGKGTAIENFTGDLYAHTGVLTDKSTNSSNWKYTKAGWTENKPECKLTKHGNNLWTLTIKGGPRAYYKVPATEKIKALAFVFRSADGSKEVKDNGNDIFINTVEEGLGVYITSPKDGTFLTIGKDCQVIVKSQKATSMTLYQNDKAVAKTSDNSIEYTYAPTKPEDTIFRAVATDGVEEVEATIKVSVLGVTVSEARPAGVKNGVNINGDEATFVLYAPGKESVILLGDFNNYSPSNEYMMKRDGDYFWTTISGLEEGVEYGYQYFVDKSIKIGDPYSTKILDPWNDKYITTTYPDLKPYPAAYTTDIVSVFELNPTEYVWQVEDFDRPKENSLAIYELLIRDFTEQRTINAVTEKLDYLETLGINAIELMPIQEFDGNDSWGYNPCFYFATDKAYGTEEDYKRFIDECHKRGIAVIVDVVFNHATGLFPYAKMWWSSNKTASNNPFFNVDAPHNFSVYHDFNHTYAGTKEYFNDVLKFWLEEYKVDGFRFDLTKGFVQNPSSYDAGGYSSQRIGILKGYANAIRAVEQDAYVIFEHFCDVAEETELYNSVGALCWCNNQMGGYQESVMGWTGNNKSSFADFKKGRVNNIETHDEERVAYKAIKNGQSWVKSDWAAISKRLQAVYAFHFLTPYPKMMWQFGELAYDVSINANDKGVVGSGDEYRTHRKPVRWNYLNNPDRKAVYDALSKVITWRTSHEDYYGQENLSVHTWNVADANMGGKTLVMDKVIVVANFTNAQTATTVNVPNTGEWTNLMTGEKIQLGSSHSVTLAGSDYIVLVKE
ncbi:MAG: Por secretion system protein [Alistipes sp.]|nr:Por secretion system protein [Alistipes sp.]